MRLVPYSTPYFISHDRVVFSLVVPLVIKLSLIARSIYALPSYSTPVLGVLEVGELQFHYQDKNVDS